MADIVDRLRTHDDARLYADADLLMAEAADEIERQRQRVKDWDELRREHQELFDGKHALLLENRELRKAQGEPVVWMQSDHLDKFTNRACGSQSMLARCSDHQLQSDYKPLYTSAPSIPDCSTCANRGEVDGLSQESHCEHCIYGAKYRTNHYAPKPEDKP